MRNYGLIFLITNMLTESTEDNLKRKSHFVDTVQWHQNTPLFSWIDINVTELCNRQCVFCPRVDPNEYPNQNLHISMPLIKKISHELNNLDYQGAVVLCGYSEPLLHPNIMEIVNQFGHNIRTEIVTNGDKLNEKVALELFENGLSYLVINLYDGPEQVDYFKSMLKQAGIPESAYILRDRWFDESQDYGLKLTNRAGMVKVGSQASIDINKPCYYLAYSMMLDWNGDVLLCVQDWNKRVKMGNIYTQTLFEAWTSQRMKKYRQTLINGRRSLPPCNQCNAEGTLHGFNHKNAWNEQTNKRLIPIKC